MNKCQEARPAGFDSLKLVELFKLLEKLITLPLGKLIDALEERRCYGRAP